jgi:hypothetical protein
VYVKADILVSVTSGRRIDRQSRDVIVVLALKTGKAVVQIPSP